VSNTNPIGSNQVLKKVYNELNETLNVSVQDSALPSGAATAAKQDDQTALLTSLDGKTNNNFGVSTGAIRTAAQVGNATGSADFGAGNTSAQTLRTVLASDQTIPVRGERGTLTDYSGSASTVDATIMASNSSRKYLLIQNLSGSINMWINFGSAAVPNTAGSIQLGTKETLIWEGNFIPTEAVHLIASSGTPTYTAKEG
jgi:hypothetical protein